MILVGGPGEIMLAVVTALLGVWLVSAGLAGCFATRMSMPMRALFCTAGLVALVPAGALPGAVYADVLGAGAGFASMAWSWFAGRPAPASQAAR